MKVAFVTPWYGADIPGGMESLTRGTAEHLHAAGLDVEVITTCIRDFHADWATNHHRPGLDSVRGVPVRRFAVQKRDRQAFDEINGRLLRGQPISPAEEQTFIQEMFRTPDLYAYLAAHSHDYLYFFVPYMFATTYFGAQICPGRSAVIPCLHEEPYAHLDIYRHTLSRVRALVFNAKAEGQLVAQLYGRPGPGKLREVIGVGVHTDFATDAGRFRQKYAITEPFVLYAGRRTPGKNTPLLLDYWRRYRQASGRAARLVCIGGGEGWTPPGMEPDMLDLGYVPLQDKYDAYAAATVFCQPSVNESFSIVIMESWLAGTPVLVHGRCLVTRDHVQQANGGLYFTGYEEFAACLDFFFDNPETAAQLARQGRRYVLANFQWPLIVAKYRQLIEQMMHDV
jgi:glycosyltransferase involved in cell wall biosynthesis